MENDFLNLEEFAQLIQPSMLLCDMRKLYNMGEKSFRRKLKIYEIPLTGGPLLPNEQIEIFKKFGNPLPTKKLE